MSASEDREDIPESDGYKVGEKKAVSDLLSAKSDEDESMRKYKESLLQAGAACPFPDDARTVIVDTFEVVIKGRDPLRFSIRTDADVAKLKDTPIVLKEDCEYQFRITFYVQREIVSGLTYVNVVKRKGIRVDKSQIMIGSYGPNLQPYQYVSPLETCPSGMLARGHYTAKTTFADDDKAQHLQFEYQFDIKKDWE